MSTQPSNRRALLTYLTAFVILATLISACAPSVGSVASTEETPLPTEPISDPTGLPGEPQPAQIDDVTVEIGVGSPIPVFAIISGNLPSPCDQIAQVRQEQNGSAFKISILTTTSIETTCIPDALPFVLRVPLSMVNLAGGDYTVEVNNKQTTFNFPNGSSDLLLPEANSEPVFQEALIDGVDMEVGVGSPIPVHLIISGSLPDICAQISEIQLSRVGITGNGFHIGVMTRSIANEACKRDTLPFRLEFPMNIVSLPNGAFNVRVNSFEASFDPRASTGTPIAGEDTAILDTSDWQAFQADSGYEIRYPLALYSVRDSASPSDVLYPGVKAITPNDSFYYGEPQALTYKISIAVRENSGNLTLDDRAGLLAGSTLLQYDPALLDTHNVQEVTLDGINALRVNGLKVGPSGITAQIVAIRDGLIYEILVEPYQVTGNLAESFDMGQSNQQSEALYETILAAFKFSS